MELKNSFRYLGYVLLSCEMDRVLIDSADKIRVGIENINLNPEKSEFVLLFNFDFIDGNKSVSKIVYQSCFRLENEEIKKEFNSLVSNPKQNLTENLSDMLLMMVHLSFPFVRAALFNMTYDLGGAINIPIIDSAQLLNGGVEFSRIKKDNE